ncbi:GNAT family N-acetyltransferase, partial [Pantoea sp. SIMBA_133]
MAHKQVEVDQEYKTISFSEVSFERDVHMIHRWMNEAHVYPFWQLNITLEAYKHHLLKALRDKHQTLYLGLINNEPIS